MKKVIISLLFIFLLVFSIFYFDFASARDDDSDDDDIDSDDSDDDSDDELNDEDSDEDSDNDDNFYENRTRERQEVRIEDALGNVYRVRVEYEERDGEVRQKIKVTERYEAETELEVETEGNDIRVRLENGQTKIVRILPNEAVSTAAQEIGREDLEVELEEENGEIYYKVEGEKEGKFLGLFRTRVRVETKVDAETGEIRERQKTWWAFLVSGEDKDQFGEDKIMICHVANEGRQTIEIDGSALRAHLAHGDVLGECSLGEDSITNSSG